MNSALRRREFLQAAVAAGTAVASVGMQPGFLQAKEPRSANEKLNLAVIGVAGRGGANLSGVSHENIAVLCDIDDQRLEAAAKKHPGAKCVTDFREVFDASNLDGIVCSTRSKLPTGNVESCSISSSSLKALRVSRSMCSRREAVDMRSPGSSENDCNSPAKARPKLPAQGLQLTTAAQRILSSFSGSKEWLGD